MELSGPYLEANGWVRNGTTYTKGSDVITYDGVWWYLNGKKIKEL